MFSVNKSKQNSITNTHMQLKINNNLWDYGYYYWKFGLIYLDLRFRRSYAVFHAHLLQM